MAYSNINKIIKPVVEAMGYIYWGIEYNTYGKRVLLRIFIDSKNGVTLDNCAEVSNQISGVLDVENAINQAYILEVSSPGLDRPLFELSHYQSYIGAQVKIWCSKPIDGAVDGGINGSKKLTGQLASVDNQTVGIKTPKGMVKIPLHDIRRANLVFEKRT